MAYFNEGASIYQQGVASDMRHKVEMDSEDYYTLSKILHSSDRYGKYAHTPNEFRDLDSKYDSTVQKELNRISYKYNTSSKQVPNKKKSNSNLSFEEKMSILLKKNKKPPKIPFDSKKIFEVWEMEEQMK